MGLGPREVIFDETGFTRQVFAKGQTPTGPAISDVSSAVVALDEDRAYCLVTLESVTSGEVYAARGVTALADAGIPLATGVEHVFYGPESVNAICKTGAATGVVLVQDFKLGVRRIGDRV